MWTCVFVNACVRAYVHTCCTVSVGYTRPTFSFEERLTQVMHDVQVKGTVATVDGDFGRGDGVAHVVYVHQTHGQRLGFRVDAADPVRSQVDYHSGRNDRSLKGHLNGSHKTRLVKASKYTAVSAKNVWSFSTLIKCLSLSRYAYAANVDIRGRLLDCHHSLL